MPTFNLGASRVEYHIFKGSSRRYTTFRFRPDLTLEVTLPRGRQVDVEKAIEERSPWLRREYDRLSRTRTVLNDDTVMFGGDLLNIAISSGPEDGPVPDLARGVMDVSTNDRGRLRELLRRWFLRESSSYAVRKVAELAPKVGARPRRVDVREIRKWGYCTRSGRLSFSWQLVALPERLREYVVLHELTHLLVFNHSADFRRKLASVCPDFKDRERELDLIMPYDRPAF